MVVIEQYKCSAFDGGSIGGRGFCSAPNCHASAEYMVRGRKSSYAYCEDHADKRRKREKAKKRVDKG